MDNNQLMGQPKVKSFHVLKIVSAIIYLAVTLYLILGLKKALGSDDKGLALATYLVFSVIIFGSIGNILAIIVALIGLVYTAMKFKVVKKRAQLVIFATLTILPVITELVFIIIVSNL